MTYHRKVFMIAWMALVLALCVFPGFELRGLAGGLIAGYWPFLLFGHALEHSHPFFCLFLLFVLSGAEVFSLAWLMDKAGASKKILTALIAAVLVGGVYFAVTCYDFETWKNLPIISQAMESEARYQPTRWDFYKSIVIPMTIDGGMFGLYLVCGVGGLWSLLVLAKRKLD